MEEREQRKKRGRFFPTLVLVWVILSFAVLKPGARNSNNAVVEAPPQTITVITPTPVILPTSEAVAVVPKPLAQISDTAGGAGFTLCRRVRVVAAEEIVLRNQPIVDTGSQVTVLSSGTELTVTGYRVSQPGIDDGWWQVSHPELGQGYVTAAHGCVQCVDAGRG